MSKKTAGRRKVELVKVEDYHKRHVTFSKRKRGIFNKANELHDVYGAEIALIMSSPGNKILSYGNPSCEKVIDRYLGRNHPNTAENMQLLEARHRDNVQQLNKQLAELSEKIEEERRLFKELSRRRNKSQDRFWWEVPVDELSQPELHQLKPVLEGLKQTLAKQEEMLLIAQHMNNPHQFFMGSSSTGVQLPENQTKSIAFDANMVSQAHAASASNPLGYNPNPQGCNPGPSEFGHRFAKMI